MRQLSGCDFCGGTASGTFEVLPAEYDPEGKGKRMLLCDHCRDALSSILDPLLDANVEGREPAGDVEPDISPASERTDAVDDTPAAESTADPPATESTADPSTDEPAGPTEPSDDATGATHENGDGGADETEPTSGSQMAATGAGSSSRVPKGYRKVLRFLENREMPIDRQAAVEMTAGAYGMDESAVDAAIEHAVNHGRLKSYDGEIRRA